MLGKQFLTSLVTSLLICGVAHAKIVTTDNDVAHQKLDLFDFVYKSDVTDGIIAEVAEQNIEKLSHHMHENHGRCGGFIVHDTLEEAKSFLKNSTSGELNKYFIDYSISNEQEVNAYLPLVTEKNINETITSLSSYHNRYYKAQTGIQSSEWIADHWSDLVASREDASVEIYRHERWPQPSIILTIKGESDETIVIGGHADSIAGYFGGEHNKAPGADDNASGIATITEVIRVLMEGNFKPKKTLKFMAYSAEEVGLLGSKEIARLYSQNNEKVVGVLQLDMTLYNGTRNQDIVLISDYTNQDQNAFLGSLIDKYLELPWMYDRCGYACSDHASWTGNGFPASFPFEAKKGDMNRKIHTSKDTLEVARGVADHPVKFAKLALSYLIELDR
jgi:leucyl aminopeptidase